MTSVGKESFVLFNFRQLRASGVLENQGTEPNQRAYLVQVLITDGKGGYWIHDDPDGHKIEAHLDIIRGEILFPSDRVTRLNAVSGGATADETPIQAAIREMSEEVKGAFSNKGTFIFDENDQVFMCYQEDAQQQTGRLYPGIFVVYQASENEVDSFKHMGRFVPLQDLYRETYPFNGTYRPAFRLAVATQQLKEQTTIETLVATYNTFMIEAVINRAFTQGLKLYLWGLEMPLLSNGGINE